MYPSRIFGNASTPSTSRDGSHGRPIRQRVSHWLDRTLRKRQQTPSPPRALPSPRPRPITPSKSIPNDFHQHQSPFFQLPPEIRHDILMEAFGNRTVHMDLTLDHPNKPMRAEYAPSGRLAHNEISQTRDSAAPREWFWRGSDCHRNAPAYRHVSQHIYWCMCESPEVDRCMEGEGYACNAWLGKWPLKCRVGAMGWLLSCRHAYDEGVGILYGTNTFHITSEFLLTKFADYILPQRLAQMSSFEIVLGLPEVPHGSELFQPSSAALFAIFETLWQRSGIKRLYLCLHRHELWTADVNVDLVHILDAMDAFVRSSDVESAILQMQSTALERLSEKAVSLPQETANPRQAGSKYQLWRCLDGSQEQAKTFKRECLYPKVLTPPKDPASPEAGRSRGYWIFRSENPMPANYMAGF